MRDSLSSADRDARIAEIEGRVTAWCVASGVNHAEFMRNLAVTVLDEFPTGSTAGDRMNKIGVLAGIDAPWLIAELRAALSREEEAKKDAEAWKELAQTNARNVMHLRERWDEAQKDVERLDWLEAQVAYDTPEKMIEAELEGVALEGNLYECWYLPGDLRQHIDASRAAREDKP